MGSSMAAGVFTGAGGFAFKVDGHLQFHNGRVVLELGPSVKATLVFNSRRAGVVLGINLGL